MNILNYVKKHKFFVGVLLFALCFSCFSSHLTFADENRLLIGSFNANGENVSLVINNVNNPYVSALATATNQTVSNHGGDYTYSNLGGAYFLDYVSYVGLDSILSDSTIDFYNDNIFVNYYGYNQNGHIYLAFVFSKANYLGQATSWTTNPNTGDQYIDFNEVYFTLYRPTSYDFYNPMFYFAPYTDVMGINSFSFSSNYFYNSSSSGKRHLNSSVRGSFPVGTYDSSLSLSEIYSSFLSSSDVKFFCCFYDFVFSDYENSVAPNFRYTYNLFYSSWFGSSLNITTLHPLASSFVDYTFNSSSFYLFTYTNNLSSSSFQIAHKGDSLAVDFPFIEHSSPLAYTNDIGVVTPTPFPTYEPWDPNNPAGGSTPTPIPSGFGGITPTPIPSVSPPPATVTPINIFYNPVIDNGSDIWGTVKSIFDDFNGFFLGNEFIKFCSSLMNNVFYFDTHFMYFVIPVYICFIMFLIGRFRRK